MSQRRIILKSQSPAQFDGVPPRARRVLRVWFFFGAFVLLVNTFVGENGLLESRAARTEYQLIVRETEHLRLQNQRLRDEARRLREDPSAVEDVARAELGLIAPGEILFYIIDSADLVGQSRSVR